MLRTCEGYEVRGSDGLKVGKVVRCDDEALIVRTGIFKVHEFEVLHEEVSSMTDAEVFLRHPAREYNERAQKLSGPHIFREREDEARDGDAVASERLGPPQTGRIEDRLLADRPAARADAEEPTVPHPEDEPLR